VREGVTARDDVDEIDEREQREGDDVDGIKEKNKREGAMAMMRSTSWRRGCDGVDEREEREGVTTRDGVDEIDEREQREGDDVDGMEEKEGRCNGDDEIDERWR
jgi:hypothetical protein